MSRKEDRQLVGCEQCGRTYPGFQIEDGEFRVIGGPTCPNCGASSFVEVDFGRSLMLSCPNCDAEYSEVVELPAKMADAVTASHDPDGTVEVTCARCGEEFSVQYEDAE